MTKDEVKALQQRLNALDYNAGDPDGDFGSRTEAAVKAFQRMNGLDPDGKPGRLTMAALLSPAAKRADDASTRVIDRTAPEPAANAPASQWPFQRDCVAFYGQPGNPQCTAGVVKLPIPFKLAWDLKQSVGSFRCHAKVQAPLTAIFNEAVAAYGERRYRELGLDLFGGCYALRQMRGGTAWSMHSWGIAVDLDPERNALKMSHLEARFARPEYADFWRIVESKGAISLGRKADYDWMHFQFARI